MRLKMWLTLINENQSEKNMLLKRIPVLIIFCFSKILFIYVCGPLQNARPQIHEMTAKVKTNTKLAGFRMMSKIFTKHMSSKSAITPNEIAAFFIDLLSGRYENNLARRPYGGYYACYFFWKNESRPRPLCFYGTWWLAKLMLLLWSLISPLDSKSVLSFISLMEPEVSGLNLLTNELYFDCWLTSVFYW